MILVQFLLIYTVNRCKTISGPNPKRECIFPFTFNGKQYYGCPIDPVDPSKRWCSTKVDSQGNHMIGLDEYGHCNSNCPIANDNSNVVSSNERFGENFSKTFNYQI